MLHISKSNPSASLPGAPNNPPGRSRPRHNVSFLALFTQNRPQQRIRALKTPHAPTAGQVKTPRLVAPRPSEKNALRLVGALLGIAVLLDLQSKPLYAAEVGRISGSERAEQQLQDTRGVDWAPAIEFAKLAGPTVTLSLFGFSLSRQLGGLDQKISGLDKQISGLDKRLDGLSSEVKSLRSDVFKIGQDVSFLQGVKSEQEKQEKSRTS